MLEQVRQYLMSKGFSEPVENEFEYIQIQNQQMIINGRTMNQEHKRTLKVVYIGEGCINDTPQYGFSIYRNGNQMVDEWFENIEQFKGVF